jgi:ATP-dependent Clp protease ATP-binding subunit ClpA
MFERFTEHGVEVIILGQGEARRYNCPFFGTEHILLGLLDEGSGVGFIVLDRCGLEISETRDYTVELLDLMRYSLNPPVVDIGFTNRAKRVVLNAITESEGFLHSYVGTEHVLMSFLLEDDGAGIRILSTLSSYSLDDVRIETIAEMRISSEGPLPIDIPRGRRPISINTMWEPTYSQTLQFEANDEDFEMELAHRRRQQEQEDAKDDLLKANRKEDFKKKGYSPLFINFFIPAPIVNEYTFNLTRMASDQLIDPVVGRIDEVNRVIQILARRRKNNAVLVGEPGVGKTAIAEGLAIKILTDDVPDELKGKMVLSLDLGLLIAGSKYRGEFEQRFKFLIMEFQQKSDYILVVDEIHTLVGSGSAEGSMDAANILKPALARGEIQCVGATTKTEYRQYIERDPALERRFQQVQVDEPTILETVSILIGLRQKYENHHLIRLTGEALLSAAQMSSQYIADRFLPDKAIDLVDEACARVRLGFEVIPEICKIYEKLLFTNFQQRCAAVHDKDYITALTILTTTYKIYKEFKLVIETLIRQFEIDKKPWIVRAMEQRYRKILLGPLDLIPAEDALIAIINEERNLILIDEKVVGTLTKEILDAEIVDYENDKPMDFDDDFDDDFDEELWGAVIANNENDELMDLDEEILDAGVIDVEIVDDENDEPTDFNEKIDKNREIKLAKEAKHFEELYAISKASFEKMPPKEIIPYPLNINSNSTTETVTREFLVTLKYDEIDKEFFLQLFSRVVLSVEEPRVTQLYLRLVTIYGSEFYHTKLMPTFEMMKETIDGIVRLRKYDKKKLLERQLALKEDETNSPSIENDNDMLSVFKPNAVEISMWDPKAQELLIIQEIETLNLKKRDYINSLEQLKTIKQLKIELRNGYYDLVELDNTEMRAVTSNDVIEGLEDVVRTTTLAIKAVNLIFYIKFRKAHMYKDSHRVCKFISWDFFNILDAQCMLLLAQDSIFYFKKSLIKKMLPACYESDPKFVLRKKLPEKISFSLFMTNSAVETLNQMGIYLGICLSLSTNIWPIDNDICFISSYIFHPRFKDDVIRDFVLNTDLKLLKHDLFLIFVNGIIELKGKNDLTFIMSQFSKRFITFSLEKETLKNFLTTDKAFLSLDKKFFYKFSEDIKLDYIASDTVNNKLIIPKFGLYNPIYNLIPVPVIFYAELLDFHECYLDLILDVQLSIKLYKTKVERAMNTKMDWDDKRNVGFFFSQLKETVLEGYTKENVIYARNELLKEKYQLLNKPEPPLSSSFTPYVFASDVAKVVSDWTGIPAESVTKKETEELIDLEGKLADRVIGQMNAIISISRALRRARVGLRSLNRPIASFLFCGPTGVGKTEVTKALAYFYFGSESIMVRFDMSEFMEKHSISKLIGSPPGYVGYADGGQLTEAVRMKPYIVVLFDEVEKAHPDIFNILLQVLDDGRLTDSQGRVVDFKNTIIIMTSNLGSAQIQEPEKFKDQLEPNSSLKGTKSTDDEDLIWNKTENEVISELVNRALKNFFRPEFINRIDEVVIFNKLSKENLEQIATIALSELSNRLLGKNFNLVVSNPARKQLVDEGFDPKFGARPLRRVITQRLEDTLAYTILTDNLQPYSTLLVDVDSLGDFIITGKPPYPVKDEEYKKYVKQIEVEAENLPPRFNKANRLLYKHVFTVRNFDYPDGVVIDENEPVELIPNFGIGWSKWAIFKDEDFTRENWWLPEKE